MGFERVGDPVNHYGDRLSTRSPSKCTGCGDDIPWLFDTEDDADWLDGVYDHDNRPFCSVECTIWTRRRATSTSTG